MTIDNETGDVTMVSERQSVYARLCGHLVLRENLRTDSQQLIVDRRVSKSRITSRIQ